MDKSKKCYLTHTLERHENVWVEYGNVISSYGESAIYMPKSLLYNETAKRVNLSPGAVKAILLRKLKEKDDHPPG